MAPCVRMSGTRFKNTTRTRREQRELMRVPGKREVHQLLACCDRGMQQHAQASENIVMLVTRVDALSQVLVPSALVKCASHAHPVRSYYHTQALIYSWIPFPASLELLLPFISQINSRLCCLSAWLQFHPFPSRNLPHVCVSNCSCLHDKGNNYQENKWANKCWITPASNLKIRLYR